MALHSDVPTRDYVHPPWETVHPPERDAARPVTVDNLPNIEGEISPSAGN